VNTVYINTGHAVAEGYIGCVLVNA